MVGELVPVAVDPGRADRDFWSRFHVLRQMRHAELDPDDPVEPDDVAEARMKRPNPFDRHHYFEVVRDGVMLGWFSGENASPANPEYETNKHLLWGDIYVRPENRRRGLATRFLPVIAQLMDRQGSTTGVVMHDAIAWEPDGTISAMTDVSWAAYRRTLIEQQFTGVRPDARGRGLGKWIKAAMVLHIRELYPDAVWIATGNAGSNAPMLKFNRTMGFKAYRTRVDYQVNREQLAARIGNLSPSP